MFKYFNGKLSQGYVSLFSGRMIQFIGYNLLGIFLPIYLLIEFNYKVEHVLLFFLIGHLSYAIYLPLGVRFLNKIGLRRSLRISVFLASLYYLCLFSLGYNLPIFVVLSVIVLTFYRTFFWMPYHIDFAKFTNKNDRGKSVGLVWATSSFLGVVMPVVSGFLISRFGYNIVFIIAIIMYLTSLIPFMTLPRTKEKYSWDYLETFRNFFKKKNRKLILANMANGAENAVGIIIWPIFIWKILEGDYLAVGAISSLIVFVTIILQLAVGSYADKISKRKLIHLGSIFYSIGWFAKIFIMTSFQIFIVGTYHSFAQIFKDTPFDSLNYEMLADHGHYVDEYTVLKEMAVQLGKVVMLIFAIFVVMNFGINWTFALASIASIFIILL